LTEAERWGRNGIEQIHAEAGGWPHLVQLVAEIVVDFLNQARARDADASLLEKAFRRAVVRGDTALRELVQEECVVPGEWEYVRGFRTCDAQRPPDDGAIHRSLQRRLLVTEEDGLWRLRVPLMQRWLCERS